MQVLIPFVNYFVVLDGDGDRLFAKYYDGRSKSEQSKNEVVLHKKTKAVTAKTDGKIDIISHQNNFFATNIWAAFRLGLLFLL